MKTILRLLLLCLLSTSYGQVAVQNMPPASTPLGSTDLTIADQGVSYPSCTTAGTGGTNACTRVATLAQIQAFVLGTGSVWSGNTISVAHGGTGAISLTGVLKGNGSAPFSAASSVDVSNLFGTCSIGVFLRGDGTCTSVSLTTNVTGILPPAAGGSGVNNGTNTLTITLNSASFASPADGLIAPLDLLQNSQSGTYTAVLGDNGKQLYNASVSANTFTIPSNASVPYQIGATLTFVNPSGGGVLTITINSDVLYLAGTTATVGTRTLTAIGIATAVKVGATTWIINGVNIT